MDAPITQPEVGGSNGKPFTVAVAGRGVDPERVVLHGEDREVLHGAAFVGGGLVEQLAEG